MSRAHNDVIANLQPRSIHRGAEDATAPLAGSVLSTSLLGMGHRDRTGQRNGWMDHQRIPQQALYWKLLEFMRETMKPNCKDTVKRKTYTNEDTPVNRQRQWPSTDKFGVGRWPNVCIHGGPNLRQGQG